MLSLPFTHLYYDKIFAIDMLPIGPDQHTFLLDCCVVNELDEEFEKYDTKWYPVDQRFEHAAKYFKLKPGPYLVLFLKSVTDGDEKYPHYWTTIRTPWCRTRKACYACKHMEWGPVYDFCREPNSECNWFPNKIPAKYCAAIGKEVRIVYDGNEHPEPLNLPDFNANGKEAARVVNEKKGEINARS